MIKRGFTMIKNLSLLLICLFSIAAFAKQSKNINQVSDGYLQAYWFPVVNDDGSEGKSELMLRFLDTSHNVQHKVIDLYITKSKNNTPDKTDFNDPTSIKLIKDNFNSIPENFFKYHEGHIEQAGILTSNDAFSSVECDTRYYYSRFVGFKSLDKKSIDPEIIARASGCGGYPYIQSFIKKHNLKDAYFKSKPDLASSNIYKITENDSVIKIKTVNDKWLYVAVSDDSMPDYVGSKKGYILKSELELQY